MMQIVGVSDRCIAKAKIGLPQSQLFCVFVRAAAFLQGAAKNFGTGEGRERRGEPEEQPGQRPKPQRSAGPSQIQRRRYSHHLVDWGGIVPLH